MSCRERERERGNMGLKEEGAKISTWQKEREREEFKHVGGLRAKWGTHHFDESQSDALIPSFSREIPRIFSSIFLIILIF